MEIQLVEQEYNSTQTKLKNMVKKLGWEPTAKAVGGFKNLIKLGFNNDPMEFLSIYNDLNVVQSEEYLDWTLFRYKKHDNLMAYDRKSEWVYINYGKIWSVLENKFELNYSEIQQLTKEWLGKVYNLRGIPTPFHSCSTSV